VAPPDRPDRPGAPGFGARRGKRSLRLLKTLRGDGLLAVGDRELAVGYQLDLYADGDRTLGSGSLDADFTGLGDHFEGREGRLTLSDGAAMTVVLEAVEDDGAEFQAQATAG